jgi:hypothetical protein
MDTLFNPTEQWRSQIVTSNPAGRMGLKRMAGETL